MEADYSPSYDIDLTDAGATTDSGEKLVREGMDKGAHMSCTKQAPSTSCFRIKAHRYMLLFA